MKPAVTEKRVFEMNGEEAKSGEIFISYFTDPLCAWSWAFESEWQELKQYLGDRLHITYQMGGLIPDWKTFHDSVNAVTRPAQMGPVWMLITAQTKVQLNSSIWMRDPPTSSYPACIAFKCAEMQSKLLGEIYLFKIRQAAMVFGENISKTDTLLRLADDSTLQSGGFDKTKFKNDLLNGAGLEAFRKDLQIVQTHRINRFPTLIIRKKGKPPVMVSGYKKIDELIGIVNA